MPEYHVIWTIDIDADSAEDAARQALAIQRDAQSIGNIFDVVGPDGLTTEIDLRSE